MRHVLLALVAATSVARADDDVDQQRFERSLSLVEDLSYTTSGTKMTIVSVLTGEETEINEEESAILRNTMDEYRGGFLQVALAAGATSDLSSPGAVHGSADLAWEIPLCKILGAHASGLAAADDAGTWALGGTACLPFPYNTVQVSYTRRQNVRSSLLRDAVVPTDRRAQHDVDILVRFFRWRGLAHSFYVMPVSIAVTENDSLDAGYGESTLDISTWMFDYRHHGSGFAGEDTSVRLFQIRSLDHADDQSIEDPRHGTVTKLSPLVLEGVPLGGGVTFGADVGVMMSDIRDRSGPPGTAVPPTLFRSDAHVAGWLGLARAPFRAQLRYVRTMVPTFGGQLVLENRATAEMTAATTKLAVRGEAFAGHATLVRVGPNEGRAIYGAGGELAYALLSHVHAIARVEGARVLAPTTDMEPAIARPELRATIGLAAHFDRRW